jgi:hypothetical protein
MRVFRVISLTIFVEKIIFFSLRIPKAKEFGEIFIKVLFKLANTWCALSKNIKLQILNHQVFYNPRITRRA